MAVTKEQVTELYVAYFERAPDADGLKYWVEESGLTIEQISQSFFDQEETKTKYPESMDTATFINAIYQNVFGRDAEPAGAVYWAEQLSSGAVSRSDMVMAVVNGAIDSDTAKDATVLKNKTDVGLHFVESGLNDTTQAKDVMSGVDATTDSVTAANAKTDAYTATAINTDMIIGSDNIGLDEAGSTATGFVGLTEKSYEKGDSVDGGEGSNSFILNLDVATATTTDPVSISNFEKIQINNNSTGTPTIDVTNYDTSASTLSIKGSGEALNIGTAATKISGVQKVISTIELDQSAKSTTSINYAPLALALDEDVMNVDLKSTKKQTLITTAGIETAVINTLAQTGETDALVSPSQSMIINNIGETIIVKGGANLTLNTGGGTNNVSAIDASKLKGGIINDNGNTISNGSNTATTTFKGGQGNDNVKFGSLAYSKIFGNEGDDTLNLENTLGSAVGDVSVDGGAGNDTITTGAKEVTITDTEGENTLIAGNGTITLKDGTIFKTISAASGMTTYTIDASDLTNDFTIDIGDKEGDITTGSGNDTITTGSGTVSKLHSGSGNDTITTGSGTVSNLDSGSGSNTLNLGTGTVTTTANATFDTITVVDKTKAINFNGSASTTSFTIVAGSGDDTIKGGTLGNTITGGIGQDTMTGGAGIDTFIFAKGDSGTTAVTADQINTFTSGQDIIKTGLKNANASNMLTDSDVGNVTAANSKFAAANGTTTSAQATSDIYYISGDSNTLYIDYDTDGVTDGIIKVDSSFVASDILA